MVKSHPKKDEYYELAKQSGFRSRDSFKLIELNREYHFLENSKVLVDLCAAPGSWLQVAAQTMKNDSVKIGIDTAKIAHINKCTTFKIDIFTKNGQSELNNLLEGAKADVILYNHNNPKETSKEDKFAFKALEASSKFLASDGTLIMRVQMNNEFDALKVIVLKMFKQVKVAEPKASMFEGEKFFVCLQFKGDNIDVNLFDKQDACVKVDESECSDGNDEDSYDEESDGGEEIMDVGKESSHDEDDEEVMDVGEESSDDKEDEESMKVDDNEPEYIKKLSKNAKTILEREDFLNLVGDYFSDSEECEESDEDITPNTSDAVNKKNVNKTELPTKKQNSKDDTSVNTKTVQKKNMIILTPEERALALKMATSSKMRREIIEWSYGKRMYDDVGVTLPKWFTQEEKKHSRRRIPFVTTKDIQEQKEQLYGTKAVDRRTIKKVEVAKDKKKNLKNKRLQKIQKLKAKKQRAGANPEEEKFMLRMRKKSSRGYGLPSSKKMPSKQGGKHNSSKGKGNQNTTKSRGQSQSRGKPQKSRKSV